MTPTPPDELRRLALAQWPDGTRFMHDGDDDREYVYREDAERALKAAQDELERVKEELKFTKAGADSDAAYAVEMREQVRILREAMNLILLRSTVEGLRGDFRYMRAKEALEACDKLGSGP